MPNSDIMKKIHNSVKQNYNAEQARVLEFIENGLKNGFPSHIQNKGLPIEEVIYFLKSQCQEMMDGFSGTEKSLIEIILGKINEKISKGTKLHEIYWIPNPRMNTQSHDIYIDIVEKIDYEWRTTETFNYLIPNILIGFETEIIS